MLDRIIFFCYFHFQIIGYIKSIFSLILIHILLSNIKHIPSIAENYAARYAAVIVTRAAESIGHEYFSCTNVLARACHKARRTFNFPSKDVLEFI